MSRFIPVQQMSKLREAARSGDERAKKILSMQLSGTEDFSSLLDEYFTEAPAPAPAPVAESKATADEETPFEMYLRENEITLDDTNREDIIREFEEMTGNKVEMPKAEEPVKKEEIGENEAEKIIKDLMRDEIDAIDAYSRAITKIMAMEDIDEHTKRKLTARFDEIKGDEVEHHKQLNALLPLIGKKEEEAIE